MVENLTPRQQEAEERLSKELIDKILFYKDVHDTLEQERPEARNTSDAPEIIIEELEAIKGKLRESVLIAFHRSRHEIPFMEIPLDPMKQTFGWRRREGNR